MDARLREQVRSALESGDGPAALRAAHALARAGEGDAAAELLALACAAGQSGGGEVLARLVPPRLESFQPRVVGARFAQGRIGALAWAPDSKRLLAVCGKRGEALVAFDRASGAATHLADLPRRGRALAVGQGGRIAACMRNAAEDGNDVALFEDGVLGPTVLALRDWLRRLSLTPGADRVLTSTTKAVRAYSLRPPTKKATWAVAGVAADFSPDGAVVVRKDGSLRLFDLGQKKARLEISLEEACPQRASVYGWPEVAATGRGAVVIYRRAERQEEQASWNAPSSHELVRLSPEGEVLTRVRLSESPYRWACSPTGRYVALGHRSEGEAQALRAPLLTLLDLDAGAERMLELPALPRCYAWSPSGQTLAVGTDEGTILLLDASSSVRGTEPAPSTPPDDQGWTELQKGERFWRARASDAGVELHYGLKGAAGVRKQVASADPQRELDSRVRAKRRGGYA